MPKAKFTAGLKEVLYHDFSPEKVYKNETLLSEAIKLQSIESQVEPILSKSRISKGHLAPAGDFCYDFIKSGTMYYINAAPQWKTINRGVWNSLEKSIRKLANQEKKTYTLYTGTYKIMKFLNTKSKPTPFYLNVSRDGMSKKLPFPRFIWKIVQESDRKTSRKGIAFLSYNNNSASSEISWPCKNICHANKWEISTTQEEGFIICCSLKEFKTVISKILDIEGNDDILQGAS